MIIFNVTTHVSHTIKEAWEEWMKQKHIPEIMEKGCFVKYQFVQLLDIDESDGVTFAIQFYAESMASYTLYVENFAPALREDSLKNWGNEAIAFRSLMKVLD